MSDEPLIDQPSERESTLQMDGETPSFSNLPGLMYRRKSGTDSVLTYCNDYATELLGYTPEEILSEPAMPFYRLIHPDDRERVIHQVEESKQQENEINLEYRLLTRDKQVQWVIDRGKPIFDSNDNIEAYEGIITKIPTRQDASLAPDDETSESSRFKTKYDFLTDLPNRHWFLQKVDAEIQASIENRSQKKKTYLLAFLDLDNFQQINDFFGREIGDYVIKQIGMMIKRNLGNRAILGRVSGDRYGIFFPHSETTDPLTFLKENLEPTTREFVVDGVEITQKFSIGVASFPGHGENLENLVTSANRALKRAKNQVKEDIVIFQESDQDQLEAEINARDQILRAIDQDRLKMVYQPIIDVSTDETIMYEALMRIVDENGEQYGLNKFKKVIREGKISRRLDRLIIQRTLEEFHELVEQKNAPDLAVNLFPPSLIDPGCFDDIHDLLEEFDFSQDRLIVEIPETLMLSHREQATKNILEAHEKYNFRFALDDFGVGHGSFKSLNSLPLDFLKIDGSFIESITSNNLEQKFVEMTAGLSEQMQLEVIGEWIENDQIAELLEDIGVDYQQGYYHAHPAPVDEWIDSS